MCGIIGYIGKQPAQPILLEGLKRMEYRGYDSSGIAVVEDGKVKSYKKEGKLQNLVQTIGDVELAGTVGIGHIRWATHGVPNDVNAHPHADCNQELFLVHNGIIENCDEIKNELRSQGHTFATETDTEVLAHLIEVSMRNHELEEAVQIALQKVVGTYGLALISAREPEKVVAARLGSPLVLGIVNDGEYIVASDVAAIIPHTRNVVYIQDGEMVTVTPQGYHIATLDNQHVERSQELIDWSIEQAEKKGFDHFMLKEIMEQPEVVVNGLRGRLVREEGLAHLGGFLERDAQWRNVRNIIIVSCGTAAYASYIGEYMLEEYGGISTKVVLGSEFRYRKAVLNKYTAVVVVSQSGETADTIASLREAKRLGAMTFGIVNVVGSTIAREVDSGAFIHAGPEVAVASTKAFMGMLNIFALLTLSLGRQRKLSLVGGTRIAKELLMIPEKIERILESAPSVQKLAEKYSQYEHAFFLGRKYNVGVALEGSHKLKEIAYVHSEAYVAGELKHGALALIDDRFYSLFIVPKDSVYEKNLSSVQQVKARKGRVVVVTTEGNRDFDTFADDVITIPKTLEMLTPMLAIVPLQLLAYYTAVLRGSDVDQPRNLAKSVTVE